MPNSSSISEFLLLALADTRQLQLLHFWLLLGIYLAALLGNGLISTAVACDHRLHTPMYFFLLNLALLDLGCISSTLPKAMANALWHTRHISYAGCAAQLFFFLFFILAEYYLLTFMAYDRYVAICKPLHYGTLLGSRACATMAAAAWGTGVLNSLLHTANTFSLPLCQGNAVDQFFCEIPQILKLSCSDKLMSPTNSLKVHSTALSKSATKRLNRTSCTCRLLKKYHCLHTATELLTTTLAVTIHPIPHTVIGPSINSYRSHTGQY
uniref:Olfactory receptor n=1 Tax=Gallus gallus TaxID=9031 RepID=A0A8V0X5S2_CHICK